MSQGRPFQKFVEIGRVVYITYGPNAGNLAVVLDVLDNNRAWVEGPGVDRQQLNFKRVSLTKFKLDIQRGLKQKGLKKAFEDAKIAEQWSKTEWAQKLERSKARAALTDFERFQVLVARKKRSALTKKNLKQLKVAAKK